MDLPVSERHIVTLVFRAAAGCGTSKAADCGQLAQLVLQQKATVSTDVFNIDGPAVDHVASPKP